MDHIAPSVVKIPPEAKVKKKSLAQTVRRGAPLLLMLALPVALVAVFNYGPIYGLQIAFKDYNLLLGMRDSPWVGLEYFRRFFTNPVALKVLRNTVEISLLRLAFGFPAPIILALMISELKDSTFKRVNQTVSYLPHFLSWIIISAIFDALLSPFDGIVNRLIEVFGGTPVYFMIEPAWFRAVLICSDIWKGMGWGSILYLAAITGVDPQLHEAAIMDGASRLQRIRHITLPAIVPVVSVVLILNMGGILNGGFDQIFNMYSPRVYDVSDIIDTFVYRMGLVKMEYSFSSAVGLFKSLVGLVMILVVNGTIRRLGSKENALW